MKGFFARATRVTPSIYFNPKNRLLDIRGKSTPENPLAFYNHVYSSIDKYHYLGNSEITVNFAFEYFNTSSSKCLFMMLKKFVELNNSGKKVVINWYYEIDDEDMCEAGEDLSDIFNFEFNFIEIPEIKTLGINKKETADKVAA